MLLPHMLHNGDIARKVLLQQKYLQNLHSSISNTIHSADKVVLLNGTWKMEVAHHWSICTWMNISHSPFGCNAYVEQCEAKGIVPYSKLLTNKGERSASLIWSLTFRCHGNVPGWEKYFKLHEKIYGEIEEHLAPVTPPHICTLFNK